MSVDSELRSLIDLFDDTDEAVVTAVNERMFSRGVSVINDLTHQYNIEKSPLVKEYIADRIRFLSNEFVLKSLEKLVDSPYIDLERGLFLISKLLNTDLDEIYYEDVLSILLEDIKKEINDRMTAMEKVEVFNHIFYKRLLFKCRDYPITRESTSNIISVMSSRHGSPIPISIIYFLLARCAGVDIYPLSFSGGFVPAYVQKNKVLFYVDVIKDGEIFSEDKLRFFMEAQGIDVENNTFEVREDKVLLIIYLESLSYIYLLKKDTETGALISRALALFGDERFLEREEEE
jgi:regulator of sirC expression with transglutaminase-like and TPR domain